MMVLIMNDDVDGGSNDVLDHDYNLWCWWVKVAYFHYGNNT